jgi:hypothetical protein
MDFNEVDETMSVGTKYGHVGQNLKVIVLETPFLFAPPRLTV